MTQVQKKIKIIYALLRKIEEEKNSHIKIKKKN